MSHFGIVKRGSPTPTPTPAVTFDTRFGTATDTSTGWITFGLRGGCRRIWVDATSGNDANNGLTAATAKATLMAAINLWFTSFTAGDQLMIAGNASYTDTGAYGDLTGHPGYSLAYPTAVLSYDPGNPADSTKYGKLTGSAMPIISFSGGITFQITNTFTYPANFWAFQGVEFTSSGGADSKLSHTLRHDGLCWQNCRWNGAELTIDNANDSHGLSQTINVSKCSFWGQYNTTDGNASGAYFGILDGLHTEDCIFAHCGWKVGTARSGLASNGAPSQLGHAHYYQAQCINGLFQRNVYVDSAGDGLNLRGSAAANCIVSLDNPVVGNLGGFSSSYTEAPLGVTVTVDDIVVMGGDDCNPSTPLGLGFINDNTLSGSYIRNAAMFDNPKYSGVNNKYLDARQIDGTNQVSQYLLLDKIRGYNYASNLQAETSTDTSKIHIKWNDAILDVSPVSFNDTAGSGNAVWSSFPLAKTRDQVVTAVLTAIGLTPAGTYTLRKEQLVNMMLWRPDVSWSQMMIDIALPAYGLTPSYPAATIPNLSAETPRAVY